MGALEKQKFTFWKNEVNCISAKENRLVFDAAPETPGNNSTEIDDLLDALDKGLAEAKGETEAAAQAALGKREASTTTDLELTKTFEKKSFAEKIADPTALENGQMKSGSLLFTVVGVTRGFRYPGKDATFVQSLKTAKTPQEFKVLVYQHLLDILKKADALGANVNKFKLKVSKSKLNTSNMELQREVSKNAAPEAQPKEEELTSLFPEAKAVAPITEQEKIVDESAEQAANLAKYGKNIEIKDTVYSSLRTTGLFYDVKLGAHIKDYDKNYKIKNPEVVRLIESKNSSRDFHTLKNYKVYEDALAKLGVNPQNAAQVLDDIVTGDSPFNLNDKLSLEDILEKTGAYQPSENLSLEKSDGVDIHKLFIDTKFYIEFGKLMKKTKTGKPYPGREKDMARLNKLYEIYIAAEKILQNLADESIKKDTKETSTQSLYKNIDLIGENEIVDPDKWTFFNFDELSDQGFATKGKGQTQIAISSKAYDKFKAVDESVNSKSKITMQMMLTTAMRAYSKDELIRQGCIQRIKNGPDKNVTYLLLTDLPANFTPENQEVRKLMQNAHNPTLADPEDDSLGWDVDEQTPAEQHRQRVEAARISLSTDSEQYYKKLGAALKAGENLDTDDMTTSGLVDASEDEVTLDKNQKYFEDKKGLRKEISADAMTQHILDTPSVTITNSEGKKVDLELFKMEKGSKVYNDKNITQYFNHLIELGFATQKEKTKLEIKMNGESKRKDKMPTLLPENFSILKDKLSLAQVQALREGYVTMLNQDKRQQIDKLETAILSGNPVIAKTQLEALKKGYPAAELKEIESKIILGAGAHIENGKFKNAGIGVGIPLGHGFGVIIGYSGDGANVSAGFSVKVYKSETTEWSVGGSIGININKDGVSPVETLGWIGATQISDSFDFLYGIGFVSDKDGTKGGATLGFGYNEERTARNNEKETLERLGFKEVEEAIAKGATTKEIAALLRKTPSFSDKSGADAKYDYLIVSTYMDVYKPNVLKQALKDAAPIIPITKFGGGVVIDTKGKLGVVAGVELRFGSFTVFRPVTQEAERISKAIGQTNMEQAIRENMSSQAISSNKSILLDRVDINDLYIDKDGRVGVLDRGNSGKLAIDQSDSEGSAKEFADQQMRARPVSLKIGKSTKNVLELIIENDKHKDLEVHVDSGAQNLGVVFNKPDQRIYLPGNNNEIVIVRENFKYRFDQRKDGPAAKDIIIVTTKAEFDRKGYNRDQIISRSSQVLEKKWTDNDNAQTNQWDIAKGPSSKAKDQINYERAYREGKPWKWDNYTETVNGVSKAEMESIRATSRIGEDSRDDFDKLEVKKDWTQISEKLFDKMYQGLRNGDPQINDYEAIIAKTKILAQDKLDPEDWNAKMTGQLLTIFQHKYFVNLWEKGNGKGLKGKEAVRALYEQNDTYVAEHVLAPTFEKKILDLKIKTPGGISEKVYAIQLARHVQAVESDKFNKQLDSLKEPITSDQIIALIEQIPGGRIFVSGTNVRTNQSLGFLTGGPNQFQPVEGYPKIGTIGEATKWNVNSADQVERDIARIILGSLSPMPSLAPEARSTLRSPLSLQLAHFDATGLAIGSVNYGLVGKYIDGLKTKPKLEADPATETALKAFVKFAAEVREASISGPKLTVEIKGTKQTFRVIKIGDNSRVLLPSPIAESASYGQCGNLSLMANEAMILITRGVQKISVVGGSNFVHTQSELSEEAIKALLGVLITTKDTPPPPGQPAKPVAGSGGGVRQTAGNGEGGANRIQPAAPQTSPTATATDASL